MLTGVTTDTDVVGVVREVALRVLQKTLGTTFQPKETAWRTLASISWNNLCARSFSQQELAEMNLALDPQSCLGRTALALAVVEKFFPELMPKVRCAEVKSDLFRQILLNQWSQIYDSNNPPPESWLLELLSYEEPHSVLIIDGKQFDPLFCLYAEQGGGRAEELAHPAITAFPPWEAIASHRFVSEAWLTIDNQAKIEKLRAAEQICPGTLLVKQNLVEPLLASGTGDNFDKAREILLHFCGEIPSTRCYVALEDLFGEIHPLRESVYDRDLWLLLSSYVRRGV